MRNLGFDFYKFNLHFALSLSKKLKVSCAEENRNLPATCSELFLSVASNINNCFFLKGRMTKNKKINLPPFPSSSYWQ